MVISSRMDSIEALAALCCIPKLSQPFSSGVVYAEWRISAMMREGPEEAKLVISRKKQYSVSSDPLSAEFIFDVV